MKFNIKWKIVIPLLIVVILVTTVYLYSGKIIDKTEKEVLSNIEKKYQLDIDYSSVNVWPLNRLTVEDLKLTKNNKTVFKAKKINLYYQVFDLFADGKDLKFDNWVSSLNYINIKNSEVFYPEDMTGKNNQKESNNDIFAILRQLRKELEGVRIHFQDTSINATIYDKKIIFDEMASDFEFTSEEIIMKTKTDLKIKKGKMEKDNKDNLTLENLEYKIRLNNDKWELALTTGYFPIKSVENILISQLNSRTGIKVLDTSGEVKFTGNIKGIKYKLQDYKGDFSLKRIKGNIFLNDIIKNNEIDKNIAIDNINGNIKLDSLSKKIDFSNMNINIDGNNYRFDGFYDYKDDQINAKINSYEFSVAVLQNYFPQINEYNFSGKGNLTLDIGGSLKQPVLGMDFYLPEGEFENQKLSNFKVDIRYRDGFFYLDLFNIHINNYSEIMIDGIYNQQLAEYNFSLKGKDIKSSLINDFGLIDNFLLDKDMKNKLDKFKGEINFDFNLSGKGFKKKDYNLLGKVELDTDSSGRFYSKLWAGEEEIIFDEGYWNTGKGNIDFAGNIDLTDKSYNFDLEGTAISTTNIQDDIEFLIGENYPSIKGSLNFSANLSGQFITPVVDAELRMRNVKFQELNIENIKAELQYKDKNLELENIVLEDKEFKARGNMTTSLDGKNSHFDGKFTAESISYDYLQNRLSHFTNYDIANKLLDKNLSLSGKMNAILTVTGQLDSPNIDGEITSNNTFLKINDKKYEPKDLSIDFTWNEDKDFYIRKLYTEVFESQLDISGLITKEGYNLSYNLNKLSLQELIDTNTAKASINSEGKIKGELGSPIIKGKAEVANMSYNDIKLDTAKGNYNYKSGILEFTDMIWHLGETNFAIKGEISNILDSPTFDLTTITERGNIDRILEVIGMTPNFKVGYYLSGQAHITGDFENPEAKLNFDAYGINTDNSKIDIYGTVNDVFDIKLVGSDVELNKLINQVDTDFDLSGKADFFGLVKGPVANFNVDLTTNIDSVNISGFSVNNVKGYLNYGKGENVNIHQQFTMGTNGRVSLDGEIDFFDEKLNLDIINQKLPLNLLKDAVTMVSSIKGSADGKFSITGDFDNPQLNGNMQFSGENLQMGLPNKFNNFSGKLNLNNNYVEIEKLSGKYADADFSVDGRIYPFNSEQFWDLDIMGTNLPFSHGSFSGRFDTDKVEMSGAFKKPYFAGELLTHDFVARMPFKWPTGGESNSTFNPEMELTLLPGEEVYFRRQNNIDVLIQEGQLNLIYEEEEFQMEGELISRQGRFDYYNNQFLLDSGTATFSRFKGVVPDLHVSASTAVDGVRITVRLDGPADNMIVTFTSQPDLTEKEILALLTQKGGIGQFVNRDEDAPQELSDFVKREFIRILQSYFQLDFISDMESELEDILRLDRIEINTYELAWNDQISIRLGKSIADKLYVEYSNQITSDNIDNKISFSYLLTDETRIEGSWLGNDDFSLSIDTTLEF